MGRWITAIRTSFAFFLACVLIASVLIAGVSVASGLGYAPEGTDIKIEEPDDGDGVLMDEHAFGDSRGISDGEKIFLVVYPILVSLYYPQGSEVVFDDDGSWNATAYIGNAADRGMEFRLLAVLADDSARIEIEEYLNRSLQNGSWPGLEALPKGTKIYDSVDLTRIS